MRSLFTEARHVISKLHVDDVWLRKVEDMLRVESFTQAQTLLEMTSSLSMKYRRKKMKNKTELWCTLESIGYRTKKAQRTYVMTYQHCLNIYVSMLVWLGQNLLGIFSTTGYPSCYQPSPFPKQVNYFPIARHIFHRTL